MHDDQCFRRIAVIGSPGAGKSTLARMIGAASDAPVIHLDKEHWLPGWTEPDPVAWQHRLAAFADRPEWVIDGQYGASLGARLARAELVVFLDLPTRWCLWRVLKRIVTTHGRTRPDMGDGCPEQLNWSFLWYVATFRRRQRPAVVTAISQASGTICRVRSRREQNEFSEKLAVSGLRAAIAVRRSPS